MFQGLEYCMGLTVVPLAGELYIVVMSRPSWTQDPALYLSVGLDLLDARIVVVKCPVSFYTDIAKEVIFLDTLGASSPRLTKLPYKHVNRPLYPFDDIEKYECGQSRVDVF